jgi:segregation and condensation protein A
VGEEDPAEALAQQLRIYKRFKELATLLEAREDKGLRTYLRLAPPPKVEARLDLSDITLTELIEAAESVYLSEKEKQSLGTVISAPKITIREKIAHIAQAMSKSKQANFKALVGPTASRLETVVTFLALLELIKRYRVSVNQDSIFGSIEIERSDDWNVDEEFELEFE